VTWTSLLANKEAQKHKTSKKELDNMRALIARDLADASLVGLSADRKFATAYNAALQAANMAIACAGYRIVSKVGHHRVSLESTKLVLPERKMGRPVASRAIELLPLRTQAKTHRASQSWRGTRPHAPKAGSSPGRAPEPLSGLAANSPICARSARGTRKPRAAYRDQAVGSLRCPRIRARSRRAAPKP
jgi:hypothetical protein